MYFDINKVGRYFAIIFSETNNDISFMFWERNKRNGFTDSLGSFITEGAD